MDAMYLKTGSGVFKVCLTQKHLITIIFRIDGDLECISDFCLKTEVFF